jgi:hypothetical protein
MYTKFQLENLNGKTALKTRSYMGGQGGAANKKGEVTNFGDLLITSL